VNAEDAKTVAILVGAIAGVATLIKGVYEYSKQTSQKRAELFFSLDARFDHDSGFRKLIRLLNNDHPDLAGIPWEEKYRFLKFYEEIALLVNSGLMRKHVAHYMFAYYAIRCWNSTHFWSDVNRESLYWSLFKHFVEQMQEIEKGDAFDLRRYTL
jgi:hypothetical protein